MLSSAAREVLVGGRAEIDTPEKWCHVGGWGPNGYSVCVVVACCRASKSYGGREEALDALKQAIGLGVDDDLADWNDAPERTHADVMAAFDKALAGAPA